MVLFLVEEHPSRSIMEKIEEVDRFGEKQSGIAFQIGVEDAVGISHQVAKPAPSAEEENMNHRKRVRVRDVMNPAYDMVDGMTTLQEALENMQHPKIRGMVVRKRHTDGAFGLLRISDIARKLLATKRPQTGSTSTR